MEYRIIRSERKTLGIGIIGEEVVVRAPMHATDAQIGRFVREHTDWIEKNLKKVSEKQKAVDRELPITEAELGALAEKAAAVIPERVKHYASRIGVAYGRITIRNQRSKWGSCSAGGNLNFNCLLMLTPPEVLDSVVVHELCHLKEMNHSDKFYAEVLKAFPDYFRCTAWLKENGSTLIGRMLAGSEKEK